MYLHWVENPKDRDSWEWILVARKRNLRRIKARSFDLPSAGSISDRSNDATVMFEPKELEKVVAETGVTKLPQSRHRQVDLHGGQAIAGLVTGVGCAR